LIDAKAPLDVNRPIMKTFTEQFLDAVEDHLKRTGTKPTEFGRQATGDPSLVLSLRRGRSPTLATADKVLAFIRQQEVPRR
jgi:predicted transcriptional regulator